MCVCVCVWSVAPTSRFCVVKEVVQVTFSFITCQHLFWVRARCHLRGLALKHKERTIWCQTSQQHEIIADKNNHYFESFANEPVRAVPAERWKPQMKFLLLVCSFLIMKSQASADKGIILVSSLKCAWVWRNGQFFKLLVLILLRLLLLIREPLIMTFSFQLKGEMKPLQHAWLSG